MGSAAWLATQLDAWMLGKAIVLDDVPEHQLPAKSGDDVYRELGGRHLLRYVDVYSVQEPRAGRSTRTWVTPTPLASDDLDSWLALPVPDVPRRHVVRLDPREIAEIRGPQWVGMGQGIQYLLPNGYPPAAVLSPGWAVEIR